MNKKELTLSITLPIILIQGFIGLIIGVIRLGDSHGAIEIPFFPKNVYAFHPELVIISFFALLILFERWQGLRVFEDRPKNFTDPVLFFMVIGTVLFTTLTLVDPLNSTNLKIIAESIIVGAIGWFLLIQLWFYKKYPAYRATTFFMLTSYFLIEINLISSILLIQQFHELHYYLLSIAVIILGERIDLAQIGTHFSKKGSKIIVYLEILGILFLVSSLIDLFLNIQLFNIIAYFSLGVFTFILLFYDITLYSAPEETKIRTFQKWGLRGGYVWLFIGVFLLVMNSIVPNILMRDAGVHAIALGFIFTMLLTHGPIVLPSLLYKPFITKIWGGLIWLILFWVLIAIRVFGNMIVMLTDINLPLIIELTGYFSIPIILGYLVSLIVATRKTEHMGKKILGNLN